MIKTRYFRKSFHIVSLASVLLFIRVYYNIYLLSTLKLSARTYTYRKFNKKKSFNFCVPTVSVEKKNLEEIAAAGIYIPCASVCLKYISVLDNICSVQVDEDVPFRAQYYIVVVSS